ncbi:RNA polymerase subunit sigma-70 [Glutamicibacter sp. JL.03c]|uniref:sigma factor-like helix-turn-helix DNA-binding protein n=1 Tax=Glutamicibacter sp. JL.03c TaxID=2984842 RepID=UPI0021F7BB2D|nr:sigma factor-like helix-turn-helix DNA-binding protein [Glutamicibacter sp. JL.03c]UYQ77085.1 RNA polymerase subunit sigma-70 [Glutamicibacter sp. JL.03c]
MEQPETTAALEHWHESKPRLTVLAYNMLGVWAQAEDVVAAVGEQVFKLEPVQAAAVQNWPAFLTTLTTRRSIDVLRSAQHQRTDYVGSWLPEPIDQQMLPEEAAINDSMLRLGVLLLLEELSPPSRAAYVLHHALGYSAADIAPVLESSPVAVRQMLSRAAKKLGRARTAQLDVSSVSSILTEIVQAIHRADIEGVIKLLAHDAVLYSDGGGKVRAARNPVVGAQRIARFLIGIERKNPGRQISTGMVNGEPALRFAVQDREDVLVIDVVSGSVQRILQVSNPDKLGLVGGNWDALAT